MLRTGVEDGRAGEGGEAASLSEEQREPRVASQVPHGQPLF